MAHFAPDGFLIVDTTGTVRFANGQAELLFGYSREELVGGSVERLVPDRLSADHRRHRDSYGAAPAARPMGQELQLLARRRDGSEFPVEVSLAPVYTDGDMFIFVTIRDVTERRRMEAELRESEARYRLITENQSDVVYRVNLVPAPFVDYVSPSVERSLGWSPAQLYDDPSFLRRIVHPGDHAELDAWFAAPETAREPVVFRVQSRDGEWHWLEQRFGIERDAEGRPVAIEGISRDITRQLQVEEERRILQAETEIEDERDRIAADLHDGVMQTMYAVGLRLNSVLRRAATWSPTERDEVNEAIQELDGAIDDIRRYVRDLRPVDFTGDLAESLTGLAHFAGATDGPETRVDVRDADFSGLDEEQALATFLLVREALSNARRHAQASRVDIELASLGTDSIRVRIEDDGNGFDAAAPDPDGHFGLKNMELRARKAGGALSIESAPGRGTVVELVMRCAPHEALPAG